MYGYEGTQGATVRNDESGRGCPSLLVEDDDGAETRLVVHHRVVRLLDLVQRVPVEVTKQASAQMKGKQREGCRTYFSMRVSTPVVIANSSVSSSSAGVPDGQPRTERRFEIMGIIGTSSLSATPRMTYRDTE